MKHPILLGGAMAILALAGCNKKQGNAPPVASAALPDVPTPANGDWSQSAIPTPEGGFLMGNPKAKVRLTELGSLTCDNCKAFDDTGVTPLIDKYVKTGKVAYEFRNYIREALDLAAALIVRCNGAKTFFPLERALYADQEKWLAKIQQTPQEQLAKVQNLPPERQFVELAKLAGLQDWAAIRGVPVARSTQCLADQKSVNQLVQMASDTTTQFPEFTGTPSFILNGKLLANVHTWADLEPKLKEIVK